MAIIIPSKYIYSMDNDKIRDNIIDKIEYNATEVVPKNEYDVKVHTERIDLTDATPLDATKASDNSDRSVAYAEHKQGSTVTLVATYLGYNSYKKTHSITVKIPKEQLNSAITSIYGGKDIKYSLVGYKNIGNASATATITFSLVPSGGGIKTNFNFNEEEISYDPYTFERSAQGKYDLPETEEYSYTHDILSEGTSITATAEAKFYDSGTLKYAKPEVITENGADYYLFTFDIVVGWRETKLFGIDTFTEAGEFPMSGTYFDFVATSAEIDFFGKKFGIDLTDKNMVYGNGTHLFSVENNEILQTTNYRVNYEGKRRGYALRLNYRDTADVYRVGKETATISCIVGDYFNDLGHKVISDKRSRNLIAYTYKGASSTAFGITFEDFGDGGIKAFGTSTGYAEFTFPFDKTLLKDGKNYKISSGQSDLGMNFYIAYKNEEGTQKYWGTNRTEPFVWSKDYEFQKLYLQITIGTTVDTVFYPMLNEGDDALPYEFPEAPMMFQMYDLVIPMVYGADKKDHPMSVDENGNPKKFKVLGTKIFYKGSVLQELYLQETIDKRFSL